jgi:hypothetical protein
MHVSRLRPVLVLALLLPATLLLDGCAHRPPPGPPVGQEAIYIPQLTGRSLFFDDQLEAVLELAAEMPNLGRRADGGGGGGPGGGGPGGGMEPGMGGPVGGIHESSQPTLRIQFTLINKGSTPRRIQVIAFDSQLGNFAMRPEYLDIPAGERASTYPVFSRLYSGGSVVIAVTLEDGTRRETRLVPLRPPTTP